LYKFYGSVLWDLYHDSSEDVCVIWRKGLRRVWDLPHDVHSVLLSPLSALLSLKDERNVFIYYYTSKLLVAALISLTNV